VLPVDEKAALVWSRLRVQFAEMGRRVNANDVWIAAPTLSRDLPVATHDADFDLFENAAGLKVVRV
jgi:predicted nucleic acid-binding protein